MVLWGVDTEDYAVRAQRDRQPPRWGAHPAP